MVQVQRKTALRVISSACCTVSENAVLVISNMPPIDLLAQERKYLYAHKNDANAKPIGRQALMHPGN